jgi:hypothetical protein
MKELDEKRFMKLFEHATERKYFVDRLEYYSLTLSKHIILYTHCYLYDNDNINFHHWGDEIINYNNSLEDAKLKGKDTYDKRKNTIKNMWIIKDHEMKSKEHIEKMIKVINKKEKQMNVKLTNDLMCYYTKMLDVIMENIARHKSIDEKDYETLNLIFI